MIRSVGFACSALIALFVLAAGCAPAKVQVKTRPAVDRYQVRTLVVLPFTAIATPQALNARMPEPQVPERVKRSDITVAVEPGLDRQTRPTVTVPAAAPETVSRVFFGKLQAREGLVVIPPEVAMATLEALGLTVTEHSLPQVVRQVAARLRADAALAGKVLVYQERRGSKLGGIPAAVGFEVTLLAADGTQLWVGEYYERQRPMNEDLLGFVQRKGVFVTAEELAREGAERVLRRFPYGTPLGSPS